MKCASACAMPRSISAAVGPSACHLCDLRRRSPGSSSVERASRRGGGDDLKVAGELAGILRRRDFGGNALLVHERAIQPRRLAPGQHVRDEIELGIVCSEQRSGSARRGTGAAARRDLRAAAATSAVRGAGCSAYDGVGAARATEGRRNTSRPGRRPRRYRRHPARASDAFARMVVASGRTRARRRNVAARKILGGADREPVIRMIGRIQLGDAAPSRPARTAGSRSSGAARSGPPRAGC